MQVNMALRGWASGRLRSPTLLHIRSDRKAGEVTPIVCADASRLTFLRMGEPVEEQPEPDEEPEPEAPPAASATSTLVPTVGDSGREYEYRTELVTAAQVLDGATLPERLNRASADGWDLVDIIVAGDRHAILLRRAKRPQRSARQVGFARPES